VISANDFSVSMSIPSGFLFGVDPKSSAVALRGLADDVESGKVRIESSRVQTLAKSDAWTTTLIRMKLYERSAPAEKSAERSP
jgi:hypothetical protein